MLASMVGYGTRCSLRIQNWFNVGSEIAHHLKYTNARACTYTVKCGLQFASTSVEKKMQSNRSSELIKLNPLEVFKVKQFFGR